MTNNLTVEDLKKIGFIKIGEWKALEALKNPNKKAFEDRKPIDLEWEDESSIKALPKKNFVRFCLWRKNKIYWKNN